MRIVVDTHVHFYPCHNAIRFFAALRAGLATARADAACALLTERADCAFFREVAAGRRTLPGGWQSRPCGEEAGRWLVAPDGFRLCLVAGRQEAVAGKPLVYGQSITDACMGWDETVRVLETLAAAVARHR